VTPRVSPSERIRAEIAELIAGATTGSLLDHFEQVARLAVRLVMQSALEAEVTEFLGRDRYARGESERAGSRNGYTPMSVKTTARGGDPTAAQAARHERGIRVAAARQGRHPHQRAGVAGDRRVRARLERARRGGQLADALGPDATVSKSTVSRIGEAIKEEFDAWKTRSLATSSWTICSVTAASSACTPALPPSRCCGVGHHRGRQARGVGP
jgi:putative transposase